MAEEAIKAGGVEITVGEKTTGEKAVEAIPIYGNFAKATEALGKTGETGGVSALSSEGSALINGLVEAGQGLAMDPLGWLVGQGLNFLISVVQPLEDAIHFVSGDGPALQQAGVFPRDVDATERYLRRIGRQRAEQILSLLLQADSGLKGGSRLSERLQLELLLLRLSGAVAP